MSEVKIKAYSLLAETDIGSYNKIIHIKAKTKNRASCPFYQIKLTNATPYLPSIKSNYTAQPPVNWETEFGIK